MNDEYLWNKTGSDTEIEALENALRTFRCHETAAPYMPATALSLSANKPHRILRLRFAFAFSAVAAAVLSVAWLFLPANSSVISDVVVNGVQLKSLPPADIPAVDTVSSTSTSTKNPQPQTAFLNVRHANRTASQPIKTIAKKSFKEPNLTVEEKYAYDQLMLALSITSSKLKIVKDTVGQIDRPNTAPERYR